MTTEEMLEFADDMRRRGATEFSVQDADGSFSLKFDPNFAPSHPGTESSAAAILAKLQELTKED